MVGMRNILRFGLENKVGDNYTELLKSYRELSKEADKLKTKIKELELEKEKSRLFNLKLFGNISHEIKTPFYGILNSVSLLKKNQKLSQDDTFNLNIIEQNSQYLLTALNDLLDYSKIEYKSIKLDKVNFNLKSELTPLLNFYKNKVEDKGLKYKAAFGSNIPKYLKGDPLRIKQILHYLISSSLKNIHKGFIEIRINAYNIDYRTFEIEMVVTDEGTDINEVQKERMLNSFLLKQGDNTLLEENIEISILLVKKLVELMNGSININSKNGIGTTFSITIPLELGVSNNSKDRFRNILLVEDNIINQKLTKAVLDHQGFNVDTASNGKIGVEKYRQNSYDLVLMDIQMPVMNGFESARLIREYEKINPLKKPSTIIAVSANSDMNNKDMLNEAGIDYFISKPFKIDKFSMLLGNIETKV